MKDYKETRRHQEPIAPWYFVAKTGMKTELTVTKVRYFNTRRGLGYECQTNKKNIQIWNDGDGGETYIHGKETRLYHDMKEMDLERLIDEFENTNEKVLKFIQQQYER